MSQQFERCAIYTRQSRLSERSFSSCEAQLQICRDTAASFDWRVVDIFQDVGQSSETLMRPEMQRLMAGAELEQFDRVVVYSVDRLSRRLVDFARLMDLFDRSGVYLTVVTDPHFGESAASRLTSNIVAAASEFQQDLTRERMAETRAAYKSRGMRVAGRVPFGYTIDRVFNQLVVVPEEAQFIKDYFDLAADGKTPAEIAELAIRRDGEQSGWNARRILQILSNRVYAGYLPGDSDQKGNHEAIVPPEQFDQVRQQVIARRKRRPTKRNPSSERFSLRGLLHCEKCDRVMTPNTSRCGNKVYRWYQCRSHAGGCLPCPGVSVRAWDMEEFVAAQIAGSSLSPKAARTFGEKWQAMTISRRAALLKVLVIKIDYHHDSRDVGIQLNDEGLDKVDESS